MENTQERETERIEAAPDQGLSRSQVAQRIAAGLDHKKIDVQTKSYGRIFRDNLCTLFNLLNVALAAAVLLVGSYRNALFILIILCNIAIGTFQEIRAKREDLVGDMSSEGTTPRQYTDLLGSLCDLTSGSGDKGTPFIVIQNYFNNYAG